MGGNGLLGKILTILEIEENMKIHKLLKSYKFLKALSSVSVILLFSKKLCLHSENQSCSHRKDLVLKIQTLAILPLLYKQINPLSLF